MKKNITAIILIFALLISFAACRRLDSENFQIETKAYIVDSDGVTHNIENEGSDYFYYDASGNKISVNSDDVVIETKKITEPHTFTPEEQSYLNSLGNVGSIEDIEDVFEADAVVPELEIDEIIPEDSFNEIDVELGENGEPEHSNMTYEELLKSETFTIEVNIKSNVNSVETSVPLKLARNGDNLYFETAMPLENGKGYTRLNFLVLDDACYVIIPSIRGYMTIPKETIGEMVPEDFADLGGEEDVKGTYVSSGEVDYNGEKYICEVYELDGATTKYFYQDDVLKRIETKKDADESITEIKQMTTDVNKSLFAVPNNYFDFTEMMGGEINMSSIA